MKRNNWMSMVPMMVALLLLSNTAFAQEASDGGKGLIGLGAGLAIGIAVVGGALGQGRAAGSAFESIARNPQAAGKINTPFFVGMAMIESLVLFSFAIAYLLVGTL